MMTIVVMATVRAENSAPPNPPPKELWFELGHLPKAFPKPGVWKEKPGKLHWHQYLVDCVYYRDEQMIDTDDNFPYQTMSKGSQ